MVDLKLTKDALEVAVGNLRFLDQPGEADAIVRLIEAMRLLPGRPIEAYRQVMLAHKAIVKCAYDADDAGDVEGWEWLRRVAADVSIIGERLYSSAG